MPSSTITLLGPPTVSRADGSIVAFRLRKELAILAVLALDDHAVQPRERLLGLLWPDAPDASARNNLRVALANLRQALGADAISADRQVVRLLLDNAAVDVRTFHDLLAANTSHQHAHGRLCAACADRLTETVALYRGEFMAGLTLADAPDFEEWVVTRREALHQQMLDALAALAGYHEQTGDYAALCAYARRQLDLEPWHEEAHRQLMRGLAMTGDRDAALVQFARCTDVLEAELGIEPSAETRALYEQIRADRFALPARDTSVPRQTLPASLTPFVGREAELIALNALREQSDVRLLTLVGAGGMGKTRLALELARGSLHSYADGVYFVALAPLGSTSALPAAIARSLDLSFQGGDPVVALRRFLRDKHLLLVLDNFEHLLDGAELVADLLQAAPRVQMVATSRERLRVPGEQVYSIEGLPYAGEDQPEGMAAVRLLVQGARRVDPGFQLHDQNLVHVLRICRLVQGMPLGIELAAAWTAMLSPQEIADEIARSADFLANAMPGAPERQRSMRAVFDWSWQLLNDDERQLLRRIAVFRGGFTREAAAAVVGASLPVLAGLVQKSLVRRVDGDAKHATRYELHELLRQFADEHLAASPDEYTAIATQHSVYYLQLVAGCELRLAYDEPQEAAAEIRAEIDNIGQAWTWAIRQRHMDDIGRSAGGLWLFMMLTGRSNEGERWFDMALEPLRGTIGADDTATACLASRLLAYYASALVARGKYDLATASAERASAVGQANGCEEGQALGQFVWGQASYWKGQRQDARAHMHEALRLIEHVRSPAQLTEAMRFTEWNAHVWLRGIYLSLGDYQAAWSHGTHGLRICQTGGHKLGEVHSLCNLADVARETHDLAVARQNYERALRLVPLVGYRWGESVIQFELGDVVRLEGNYGRANTLIERGLAVAREIGDTLEEARAALYLGHLRAYMGDAQAAHNAVAFVLRTADTLAAPELRVEGLLVQTILARQSGDQEGALMYAEETYALACEYSSRYRQAHALVLLAHTLADAHRPAMAAYEQAIIQYEALGNKRLACEPRAGLAALLLAADDRDGAFAQVTTILEAIATHPRVGLDEPFFVYLTCIRVLRDAGDRRWVAVLRTAQTLLRQCADTIDDAALRRSFLERVPLHHAVGVSLELVEAA